jgi:hypothetical protein
MPEQLPASQFAVGGQSAVVGHIVGQTVDSFEEDTETKTTTAGQFKCEITYSRRATKSFTMELANTGATAADYVEGGCVDAAFAPCLPAVGVWEIRSATVVKTRGPVQVSLNLVSLTESIAAP